MTSTALFLCLLGTGQLPASTEVGPKRLVPLKSRAEMPREGRCENVYWSTGSRDKQFAISVAEFDKQRDQVSMVVDVETGKITELHRVRAPKNADLVNHLIMVDEPSRVFATTVDR